MASCRRASSAKNETLGLLWQHTYEARGSAEGWPSASLSSLLSLATLSTLFLAVLLNERRAENAELELD